MDSPFPLDAACKCESRLPYMLCCGKFRDFTLRVDNTAKLELDHELVLEAVILKHRLEDNPEADPGPVPFEFWWLLKELQNVPSWPDFRFEEVYKRVEVRSGQFSTGGSNLFRIAHGAKEAARHGRLYHQCFSALYDEKKRRDLIKEEKQRHEEQQRQARIRRSTLRQSAIGITLVSLAIISLWVAGLAESPAVLSIAGAVLFLCGGYGTGLFALRTIYAKAFEEAPRDSNLPPDFTSTFSLAISLTDLHRHLAIASSGYVLGLILKQARAAVDRCGHSLSA